MEQKEVKERKGDGRDATDLVSFGYRQVRPDEKERLIQDQFDAIARKYDLMNTVLSFGMHLLWKRTAVAAAGLREGERVLDVCGGTGDLSLLAGRGVGNTGAVVLCDMNRTMMEAGKERMERSSAGRGILWVQGDAEQICFRDNSFDRVLVAFGVRNLVRLEEGLREMCRVLKPGGRFVCLEFSRPTSRWFRRLYDFYSFYVMPLAGRLIAGSQSAYTYLPESVRTFPDPERLCAILREAGFSSVGFRRLTNGIAVIHVGGKDNV